MSLCNTLVQTKWKTGSGIYTLKVSSTLLREYNVVFVDRLIQHSC